MFAHTPHLYNSKYNNECKKGSLGTVGTIVSNHNMF